VRDALDVLLAKSPEKTSLRVVERRRRRVWHGPVSTSAAIERLDFLICYDNGATRHRQQASGATPFGARTATSRGPCGFPGAKKDLFAIWVAHRPAYVATVIACEPLDLARKIEKAAAIKGPRLILALAPCPTGWEYDPRETAEVGRLAVKTGIWPLKEYADGRIVHTKPPRERAPIEEYLKLQGRFAPLSAGEERSLLAGSGPCRRLGWHQPETDCSLPMASG
jgi:pyruvate ferredoxin oxidoreductase beta subunit